VIEADGAVRIQLPWFRRGILETTVTGRSGSTPFMRWGNAIAVVAALALAVSAALAARRAAR
jgi:apolipoprotein N-acyltransferase